jgi:hypothetical protein
VAFRPRLTTGLVFAWSKKSLKLSFVFCQDNFKKNFAGRDSYYHGMILSHNLQGKFPEGKDVGTAFAEGRTPHLHPGLGGK